MANWRTELETELARATQARTRGNEGQARVCARRAAGVAIREYFNRRGVPVKNSSAYDLLNEIVASDEIPEEVRQSAHYLTLRVDETFKLPVNVDLVVEARHLAEALLSD